MEILIVLQIITTILLVIIILLQKSNSEGLVSSSGNSVDSFLAGRQAGNFLTRTTSLLAIVFIVNSLILSYLATNQSENKELINQIVNDKTIEKPLEKKPDAIPSVPKAK
jgi:preprotein translocase subunit SecG